MGMEMVSSPLAHAMVLTCSPVVVMVVDSAVQHAEDAYTPPVHTMLVIVVQIEDVPEDGDGHRGDAEGWWLDTLQGSPHGLDHPEGPREGLPGHPVGWFTHCNRETTLGKW